MTTADFAFLAFIAVLGLLGWLSGAIRQLSHWAGLALAYFCARPLAAKLTPSVTPKLAAFMPAKVDLPAAVVNVGLSSALFSALFIVGTITVSLLVAKVFGDHENGKANRAGGLLLGAGKGAALVFAALAVILFLEKPLTQAFGGLPEPLTKSVALGLVRAHNPLEEAPLPALKDDPRLAELLKDPRIAEQLPR